MGSTFRAFGDMFSLKSFALAFQGFSSENRNSHLHPWRHLELCQKRAFVCRRRLPVKKRRFEPSCFEHFGCHQICLLRPLMLPLLLKRVVTRSRTILELHVWAPILSDLFPEVRKGRTPFRRSFLLPGFAGQIASGRPTLSGDKGTSSRRAEDPVDREDQGGCPKDLGWRSKRKACRERKSESRQAKAGRQIEIWRKPRLDD